MIGGKSYDDYLRDQERKNRGQGLSGRDTYRPEVPEVRHEEQKTQTSEPKKGIQPAALFFVLFGMVFFIFGLSFMVLFVTVMPLYEEDILLIFFVPALFVVIGIAITASGIYYAVTGTTPQNVTINGISAEDYNRIRGYDSEQPEEEEEEEYNQDTSRLSTDWKS